MRRYFALAFAGVLAFTSTPSAQQGGALQSAAAALGAANIKTLAVHRLGRELLGRTEFLAERAVAARDGQELHRADQLRHRQHARGAAARERTGDAARRRRAVLRRAAPDPGRGRRLRVERGGSGPERASGRGAGTGRATAGRPERMLALWATPVGFVKAAMANNATTKAAGKGTERVVHRRRQVQDDRHDQRAGPGRESADLDRPSDRRRHARRNDLHRLQGLRRRDVPVAHRADAGRLSLARSHDRVGDGESRRSTSRFRRTSARFSRRRCASTRRSWPTASTT